MVQLCPWRGGGLVGCAATGDEACSYVVDVCSRAGAKVVAKSKSMATEEIRLNAALEQVGVKPVETDLGEYILQRAGEHPAHIVAPAIDKTAQDVAELFSRVEGRPVEAALEPLARAARRQLREVFESADVGLTGANFGVCETGSICLVTNEGNGRLVSSLPRVHVAILGMERLPPPPAGAPRLPHVLGAKRTGHGRAAHTSP